MLKRLSKEYISYILDNLRDSDKDFATLKLPDIEYLTSGQSIAYALIECNKVIAIGGVRELWSKRGEAWMIASKEINNYPISISKAALNVFCEADAKGFKRIQCTVEQGFDSASLWIEKYGFHIECLMKSYDMNGNNHFLYARLTNG